MKKLFILSLFTLQTGFLFAQVKTGNYSNDEFNLKLNLTENNFFHFQNLNGLIKEYVRGEWKSEGNQLILIETAHSEKSENKHSNRKAPKFDYTTAKRKTMYTIDGNKLIFVNQEIEPKHAEFQNQLFGNFTSDK